MSCWSQKPTFLPYETCPSGRKNTKYSKGIVFFKIKHLFQNMPNCILHSYFQTQHQYLSKPNWLNHPHTQKRIGDGPSNRIDCTTYRSMLLTHLVFLRNWWSQVFYLIRCIMPSLTTLRIVFLFFSFLCWEKCFLPNLGLISYISSSNSRFSSSNNKFCVITFGYLESALETE